MLHLLVFRGEQNRQQLTSPTSLNLLHVSYFKRGRAGDLKLRSDWLVCRQQKFPSTFLKLCTGLCVRKAMFLQLQQRCFDVPRAELNQFAWATNSSLLTSTLTLLAVPKTPLGDENRECETIERINFTIIVAQMFLFCFVYS